MITYVVAVSGGVDSVVLLDMIAKKHHPSTFVVAHVDHGIRVDSQEDRMLVEELSKKAGVQFFYTELGLGRLASEELARQKRYDFLFHIKEKVGASQIVTAHHYDDLLETALFNLLRGTGRRGVVPFESREEIARPLRNMSKDRIVAHAKKHKLEWREDSTNNDESYARNRIRNRVIPFIRNVDEGEWDRFQLLLRNIRDVNVDIDFELRQSLISLIQKTQDGKDVFILQEAFSEMPREVAQELLLSFVRLKRPHFTTSKARIQQATVDLSELPTGKTVQLGSHMAITIKRINRHRALLAVDQALAPL